MTTFSAIILAGGASKRFGSPKAGASFLGRPMLAWAVDAASAVAEEIVLVGAPGQALPGVTTAARLVRVDDECPYEGPLAGVLTGLRMTAGEWTFVLGCDMPLITGETLAALATMRGDAEAVVPRVEGQSQPLAALYRREPLQQAADAAWRRGERSLRGATAVLATLEPTPNDLGEAGDIARAFRPANTPSELAVLEAWAREKGPGTLGSRTAGAGEEWRGP